MASVTEPQAPQARRVELEQVFKTSTGSLKIKRSERSASMLMQHG